MNEQELKALRRAFRDYKRSEGCSCCRGDDHDAHGDVIGRLLGFPRYSDDSGYDLYIRRGDDNYSDRFINDFFGYDEEEQ